jgi:hypothetical protein
MYIQDHNWAKKKAFDCVNPSYRPLRLPQDFFAIFGQALLKVRFLSCIIQVKIKTGVLTYLP